MPTGDLFFSSTSCWLQEGETVAYPRCSTEIFESCELLVSLLNELDDDELEVTACCLQDVVNSQSVITAVSFK